MGVRVRVRVTLLKSFVTLLIRELMTLLTPRAEEGSLSMRCRRFLANWVRG